MGDGAAGRCFAPFFFLPVMSLLVTVATACEYLLHLSIGAVNRLLWVWHP